MSLKRTYFNRLQASRVLAISPRQLRRWQQEAQRGNGPALLVPARPGSDLNSQPQYHIEQIRLIDKALAEPARMRELDETWRTIKTALPELTLAAADEMGLLNRETA